MSRYAGIHRQYGDPVVDGRLNEPCVDAMIAMDRIDHDRGACDDDCYWCEDAMPENKKWI